MVLGFRGIDLRHTSCSYCDLSQWPLRLDGAAHILIVDDDPRIRKMLIRYFEQEGYRISGADRTGLFVLRAARGALWP